MSKYLDNVEKLEKRYKQFKFDAFEDYVQVGEPEPYFFQSNEEIKEEMQKNFGMKFSKKLLWFIPMQNLAMRELRLEPRESLLQMRKNLKFYISMLNEQLQTECNNVIDAAGTFYSCPAAKFHHHAYEHGLIEHTLEVIGYAIAIKDTSKIEVDSDVLIASALLHDIGKTKVYYANEGKVDYIESQYLNEHTTFSLLLANEFITIKKKWILHVIEAHHTKQWGATVDPITQEAKLVAFADQMSAQLF